MPDYSSFHLERKEWESFFFKKEWGVITWRGNNLKAMNLSSLRGEIHQILIDADELFELLEFKVSNEIFWMIPLLEETGFRLVDSQITFITLIDSKFLMDQKIIEKIQRTNLVDYNPDYLEDIISLTDKYLTRNGSFVSRFKNPIFFESGAAGKYFTTWVENSIQSVDSLSCVLLDESRKVRGYFIYEKKKQ